jgi:hypothetical protein
VTEYHLAVEMTFSSAPPATDEQFEEFLDEVVAQMESIGREVNLAARTRDRVADFATSVESTDFSLAASALLVDLRTALHAAGCHTPEWPQFKATEHTVRELQGT